MTEPGRDVVRRQSEPERPAVDVQRRNRRIPVFVDAGGDAGWVGIQQSRGKRDVSEARRHEDVGRGPALEQTPAHVRTIDQRVLRGR